MKIFRSLLVRLTWVFAGAALMVALFNVATAQQKSAAASAEKDLTKGSFALKTKKGQIASLSLRSKEAKLSDITAELSKRLKVPVFLSAVMQKQQVSVDFNELTLEPALQLLAPQVFIDYQVSGAQQVPLGIYLWGYNEVPPAINSVVPSSTQALLIEGDTEDGVEPKTEEERKRLEEKPLRISLLNNNLTIHAKQQPLMLILLKVGEELGVPVEIKDEPRELITTDIVAVPWEDAIQRLSPNIRIYVRADLMRLDRRPLRMVLMAPGSENQTSAQTQ
ncbi:MAG TPA: hypothetical protein VIB00_11335 [Pyrinomonadaceae bacterium]|jgi:hypothetical protein